MSIQVEFSNKGNERETQTPYVLKILHRKCPIVKLIRRQIEEISSIELSGEINSKPLGADFPSPTNKRNFVLASAIAMFIIWVMFIYGAYVGASICSNGPSRSKVCTSSSSNAFVIPGFMSFSKYHKIY